MTTSVQNHTAIVSAVTELAPRFRDRSAETDRLRTVPQASLDDLRASGMISMLAPKTYGGSQASIRDFVDATAAAAYGCPSTGWCGGQSAFAALVVAGCTGEAQQTVYAKGADVFLASSTVGFTAVSVAGGFKLSGRGPFASGVLHADWLYLGSAVTRADGGVEDRFFIVPRDQVSVDDDWYTTAMRGTGSNTVVVDDVFVPSAMTVLQADLREGTPPGAALHGDYLYRLPWVAVVPLIYTATMLGAARAAYDSVVPALRVKRAPSGRAANSEDLQVRLSMASAKIEGAYTIIGQIADRADSTAPFSFVDRAAVTRSASYAASVLIDAADDLVAISGTAAFDDRSFVQRAWRDIRFAGVHQALSKRLAASRFAQLELESDTAALAAFY